MVVRGPYDQSLDDSDNDRTGPGGPVRSGPGPRAVVEVTRGSSVPGPVWRTRCGVRNDTRSVGFYRLPFFQGAISPCSDGHYRLPSVSVPPSRCPDRFKLFIFAWGMNPV